MRKATIILLITLLIFGLNVGCNSKAPAECRQLCSLPEGQQHQTFKSLPVEKQVDLYLGCKAEKSCWRDSVSPQDDFGRWMAEDDKAASSLTERLKAERNDENRREIIYALRLMAVNGHLKGRRHIAEVVNQAADGLEDGDERVVKQTQTWAREVEGNTR
jgi:uncharacterized protein YeaO (DUF488 family)